jgi:hypothetical protein
MASEAVVVTKGGALGAASGRDSCKTSGGCKGRRARIRRGVVVRLCDGACMTEGGCDAGGLRDAVAWVKGAGEASLH